MKAAASMYRKDLRTHILIPFKKLIPYIIRAQNGDITARNIVTISSIPLILTIANKHTGYGLEFVDLVQESVFGVFNAIKDMDFNRAGDFGTFATVHIKASIYRALGYKSATVRIPYNVRWKNQRIQKYLLNGLTIGEIASKLGRRERAIKEILDNPYWLTQHKTNSLCFYDEEAGEYKMGEEGQTTVKNPALDNLLKEEMVVRLYQAINKLTKQDRYLIRHYYGLDGTKQLSQVELADVFNITPQAISRRIAETLKRLRKVEELKDVRP